MDHEAGRDIPAATHTNRNVRRGFVPEDEKQFSEDAVRLLRRAGTEVRFLLNRRYDVKSVTRFVGNHYLFSERQRLALARSIAPDDKAAGRKSREIRLEDLSENESQPLPEVNIDGFNTIITLETALSGSPVFRGMDGCIRDLAGLRGTYRIIDKTETAVDLLLSALERLQIGRARIFLDAPVSNSCRLKALFYERLEALGYSFPMEIYVINDVDAVLKRSGYVVSSDSVILDACRSWINLVPELLEKCGDVWMIDLDILREAAT